MLRQNISNPHAWVQARLSDYMDNQLARSDRAQLDKHLGECADCRARLEELKWTLALLKQAPTPITHRSFALAVPPKRQPAFVFGLASVGAALATILLIVVIGFDLLTQSGGGLSLASAPAQKAAFENTMPTQAIALAPQPTAAPPLAAPTSAPKPTSVPKSAGPASSAASSSAALPPAPAFAMPTATNSGVVSTTDSATTATLETLKSQATASAARSPLMSGAAVSPTLALTVAKTATPAPLTPTLLPTPTATVIPLTATSEPTTVAQARAQSTRAPNGPVPVQAPPLFSPVRLVEIGLLFGAVFMIVLVVLLRRNR